MLSVLLISSVVALSAYAQKYPILSMHPLTDNTCTKPVVNVTYTLGGSCQTYRSICASGVLGDYFCEILARQPERGIKWYCNSTHVVRNNYNDASCLTPPVADPVVEAWVKGACQPYGLSYSCSDTYPAVVIAGVVVRPAEAIPTATATATATATSYPYQTLGVQGGGSDPITVNNNPPATIINNPPATTAGSFPLPGSESTNPRVSAGSLNIAQFWVIGSLLSVYLLF